MSRLRSVALLLVIASLSSIASVRAQDPEPPVDPPADAEKAKDKKPKLSPEEQARRDSIRAVFRASKISFDKDGVVTLEYDFSTLKEELALDWSPSFDQAGDSMRWATGDDAPRGPDKGVHVAESGVWLHNGAWREVELDLQMVSVSEISKPGDIIAAVFTWNKGRRIAGNNLGSQLVKLNRKLKLTAKPLPASMPTIKALTQKRFGYKVAQGVMSLTNGGKRTAISTVKDPKFFKKLDTGRAGVAWRGPYIKSIVRTVKLTGRLDPKWIEKQLGE